MLLTAVGDKAPLNEDCFCVMADGVQMQQQIQRCGIEIKSV